MTQTLSDKIAGILSAAPTSFDPEDDVHEETAARVEFDEGESENEDDLTLGRFRKQNVELLEEIDKRYEGKRASRKKLEKESEVESESDEEEETEDSDELKDKETNSDEESSDEESDIEDEYESSVGSDNENNDIADNTKVFKQSENISQLGKSACVRQQLNIWESFLEMRIQLQKCLLTSNKLPQPTHFREIQSKCANEFTTKVKETGAHVKNLLDKFLYLQLLLLRNYPETNKILSKNANNRVDSDEEIPSDTDEKKQGDGDNEVCDEIPNKRIKLTEYSPELSSRFDLYHSYRNTVLQKWHDKTRIGSNKSGNIVHSVTEQITHILNNREKLVKATQLKRTDYDILGINSNSEVDNENVQVEGNDTSPNADIYNANIFDDTDFYHHLLRELIEFKSADLTDPVKLGQQWMQLQSLRSKMKKKVDTKATKGRKIRYVVHSKLVNFMAPIDDITWQEAAKNELYSSLFGKNQSSKVATSTKKI